MRSSLNLQRSVVLLGMMSLCWQAQAQNASTPEWILDLLAKSPTEIEVPISEGSKARLVIHKQTDRGKPREGLTVAWVILPRGSVRMFVEAKPVETSIIPAYERSAEPKDVVVTSGGFFETYNTCVPEGLVISNKTTVVERKDKKFGGFLLSGEKGILSIKPISEKLPAGIENAIQGDPILVRNGVVDNISPDNGGVSNRVAVGLRTNGDIVIAGAFADRTEALTLFEFASLLAVPIQQSGPGVDVALNLEGFRQAHMYIPSAPAAYRHFGEAASGCLPDKLHFAGRTKKER